MLISLIAIALLLAISAFFSGAETALTAASRARIHHIAQNGDTRASTVEILQKKIERLIGTLLMGNMVVNIVASSLATAILIRFFDDAGVFYASLIMSVLIIIFSEVMPKIYAVNNAIETSLKISKFVFILVRIFGPITLSMEYISKKLLKVLGAHLDPHLSSSTSLEELRGVIDLHAKGNHESLEEHHMLHSILDLADVDLSQVMLHRKKLFTINIDDSPETIIDSILKSPFTRIPVWKESPENIIAIIHSKALVQMLQQKKNVSTQDILSVSNQPWFVPESTTLIEQLAEFRKRREHMAMVVDEYGSLMGAVTLEDILEEIVGEILDEHDITATGIRAQANGSYLIEGTVNVRDLNRQFDWDLPDEDASTIAGLVLLSSRTIPESGHTFLIHDYKIQVVRRKKNQILSVLLTPPQKNI